MDIVQSWNIGYTIGMTMRLPIVGTIAGILLLLSPTRAANPEDLFIISPAPGEVIFGSEVAVKVKLGERFALTDPESQLINREGQGHLHIWMDALPGHDDSVSYALNDKPEYTVKNVAPGLHTIYVEFFNNDHSPYDPRLIASVEFESAAEEILPQGGDLKSRDSGPSFSSGIFLPPGSSNVVVSVIFIAIVCGVLWYCFGRRKS